MAGGQERILRGRIRTIQSTKKITRAMELIAASRIVKAQQRVHAAVPYSDKITEVVRDLAAAGAAHDSPLLAGRDDVRTTAYVVLGRRPRPVRRLQHRRAARRRGRDQGRRRRRQAVPGDHGGPEGRGLLPLPRLPARRGLHRVQRQPDPCRRQAHRRPRRRALHERSGRPGRARVHPLHQRRQPGGRAAAARAVDGGDDRGWRRPTDRRGRAAVRRLRVRARPDVDPRGAAAELRRGPRVRRPAQRRGVRARLPSAGDEGGHRQRRRAHQDAQPGHEPGPPGLHHDRDHGDRRRRRGARRRQREPCQPFPRQPRGRTPSSGGAV